MAKGHRWHPFRAISKGEKKLADEQVARAAEIYLNTDRSIASIAREFGVCGQTLSTYFKELKVEITNKQLRPFPECLCGCGELLTDRRAKYKRGHGSYKPFLGRKHSREAIARISRGVSETIAKGHHYHRRFYYKGIAMRSSWEVDVASWLDHMGVGWEYESRHFETSKGAITLDFYIPSFDCFLEVKGYWFDDALEKFQALRSEYPEVSVFIVEDMGVLGLFYLFQKLFEKSLGHDVTRMTEEERISFVKEQALLLYTELSELVDTVPYKDHKVYVNRTVDREKFLSEWVDSFAHLVNILAAMNIPERKLVAACKNVQMKNFLRQRVSYVGTTSEHKD